MNTNVDVDTLTKNNEYVDMDILRVGFSRAERRQPGIDCT